MLDNGYVYVLINPSMENLVKIGKTLRDPTERAKELSSTTGVPTPFIVVYDCFFKNCSEAEIFVHTFLENKGYRVAKNREFFEIPIKDAIDAVMRAKKHFNKDGSFTLNVEEKKTKSWVEMFEIAEMHYYGLEDNVVDYEEAMKYYLQAAKLGSINSYRKIGVMHKDGEGVKIDIKSAMRYFKEGVKKGDVSCYGEMGELFQEEDSLENAQKCWNKYFELAPYIEPFLALYYVTIGVKMCGLKLQHTEKIMQLQIPEEVKNYIRQRIKNKSPR